MQNVIVSRGYSMSCDKHKDCPDCAEHDAALISEAEKSEDAAIREMHAVDDDNLKLQADNAVLRSEIAARNALIKADGSALSEMGDTIDELRAQIASAEVNVRLEALKWAISNLPEIHTEIDRLTAELEKQKAEGSKH